MNQKAKKKTKKPQKTLAMVHVGLKTCAVFLSIAKKKVLTPGFDSNGLNTTYVKACLMS